MAAACSGGIITAGLARSPGGRGRARRGRQPDADGVRARQRRRRAPSRRSPPATSPPRRSPSPRARATSTGEALAGVFTWLRPNDLVWSYVVNNYLLGKDAAGVRHPVLEPGHGPPGGRACTATSSTSRLENAFTRPGALEVLGTPGRPRRGRRRQLLRRRSERPHRPVGERVPQRAAVRRRRSASCSPRSGHIQALVNPPAARRGESRSSYRVADELPATPRRVPANAPKLPGSWWPD